MSQTNSAIDLADLIAILAEYGVANEDSLVWIQARGGDGGGSTFSVASTAICPLAPTTKQGNPNGKAGFVQIFVNMGFCQF